LNGRRGFDTMFSMEHLPPLYQCDLCGRDILRIEKDVWMRVEGFARVTRKGRFDHNNVRMIKGIGGVACRLCVEIGDGMPPEQETLF
jgi:hypothetical protein